VEQGGRAATATLLAAVAKALHVDRSFLTGRPYRPTTPDEEAVHGGIADLRREVAAHGLPPLEERSVGRDLASRVTEAATLRQASRYAALGAVLPGLIADLRHAAAVESARERLLG
jgi:hypothetical protein